MTNIILVWIKIAQETNHLVNEYGQITRALAKVVWKRGEQEFLKNDLPLSLYVMNKE